MLPTQISTKPVVLQICLLFHRNAYLLHVYKEKSTGKTATKFHLSLILLKAFNTKY